MLTQNEYKKRHVHVSKYIRWSKMESLRTKSTRLLLLSLLLALKMLFLNLYVLAKSIILRVEASYTGKTFRHMKVRVSEHQGVLPRTGKHLKGTLSTSVRDHMLDCNHMVSWDDFKVLGRESNHWLLEIKESLFIKRDISSLNKNIYSQEFFLF